MIEKPPRVFLDTNVIVSRVILPNSLHARAVNTITDTCDLLLSAEVISELEEVFRRPKLDRYNDLTTRLKYLWALVEAATPIQVVDTVTDCHDPKDNKFLELALSGKADVIVTGDDHLLCLHPWRGILILTPADYLARSR